MGFSVDVCDENSLSSRLSSGKYNVVVIGTMNDASRASVEKFAAAGGGVFLCNPEGNYTRTSDWTATNLWLTGLGARPRWELLRDSDAGNLFRDSMGYELSWSDRVSPEVSAGVRGVLSLTVASTGGLDPLTSFDLSPDWRAAVVGAQSLKTVPEIRNDPMLVPWLPKTPISGSPALLALRDYEKGRMALIGLRTEWLFTSPPNCPTVAAMLSAGAQGKPSDWLLVIANTFRWLAQPSMASGQGGMTTPPNLLNPPVEQWEIPKTIDWTSVAPVEKVPDQPQVRGLIGARTQLSTGQGTVADYAAAAKAAGLQYIVFLEDSLAMDQSKWDELIAQCAASSDDSFKAIPGLTYEDAQGDHLYAFSDEVKFPKTSLLLPDKRLATTQSMRSRAYFDYVNEYMLQKAITGFWNHKSNFLPVADYKLYNSFPIYSFNDGSPIDDSLDDYLYLNGNGGCQAPLAFEMMSKPSEVAERAEQGWKVVRISDGDSESVGSASEILGDTQKQWYRGAFSFSGSGSQYITNGPQILVWQCPNRIAFDNGLWWRPDLWEYRLSFRVAADAGLKSITIYDGNRAVVRRWNPAGSTTFQQDLVLSNAGESGLLMVVEDLKGRKAVSSAFWNRNLINDQFICSDRCNFLGNSRLRTSGGGQTWTPIAFQANMGVTPSKGLLSLLVSPAVGLTANSPTEPTDGAPAGFPTATLDFTPRLPGELPNLFAYPETYLVGPDAGIGQADIKLGYDPLEVNAKTSPLGEPYEGRQDGWGNSWGSWHHLIPTRMVEGWCRLYAFTWLTHGFRLGAFEANLTVKDHLDIPDGSLGVTSFHGELWQLGKKIGDDQTGKIAGQFGRGTFATLQDNGGATVLIGQGDDLFYNYDHGQLLLTYRPGKSSLMAGDKIHYMVLFAGAGAENTTQDMLNFATKFGVSVPGTAGYAPKVVQGRELDNYFLWSVDALGQSVGARIPQRAMPGFLTARVQGLNDNWTAFLVDGGLPRPNYRPITVRDGVSFVQLDLNDHKSDLFIGHPVVAGDPLVRLSVAWKQSGLWTVEAHNPTEKDIKTVLKSSGGWPFFQFKTPVILPAGKSLIWNLPEQR